MSRTSTINQIPDPPALKEFGWFFWEKCTCVGKLTYKYRHKIHKTLELEWWVRYAQFRITYHGTSTKVPPTKLGQMAGILAAINEA